MSSFLSYGARWPWLVIALLAAFLPTNATAQFTAADEQAMEATIDRLGMTLPDAIVRDSAIRNSLSELAREACDQKAIANLATALDKAGYRRDAANALLNFSDQCGGQANIVRKAANILLELSDHASVVRAATEMIKLEPFGDNGYFLRAVAYERRGNHQKAVDDYATAIELFGHKERISSVGYVGMARSYDKLGRPCDAAHAIESWVAINPALHDTTQTRAMIAEYATKGRCTQATGTSVETFPVTRPGQVVRLAASINGVRGNFILDTGATYVSLRSSFAEKAKIDVDKDSSIKLHTANGIVEAKRGQAKSVQLRSLTASNVAVVVQDDAKATYGAAVDGLLGMSFLSRFNIAIEGSSLTIKARGRSSSR